MLNNRKARQLLLAGLAVLGMQGVWAQAQTVVLQTDSGAETFQCTALASAVLSCENPKSDGSAVVISERDYYPYWHPNTYTCTELSALYASSPCPQFN